METNFPHGPGPAGLFVMRFGGPGSAENMHQPEGANLWLVYKLRGTSGKMEDFHVSRPNGFSGWTK